MPRTLPILSRPPRGWSLRESYSTDTEQYQMSCGHYQKRGVYACDDCNLAPLSDFLALHQVLTDLVDAVERDTPTGRRKAAERAKALLEALG
jgi:hypothetical protein